MVKAFGIVSPLNSVLAIAATRENAEKLMEQDPMLAIMSEIIELEVNTEEMTDRGRAIQAQIAAIWEDKQIINFRFDKGPKWYGMNPDDRAQFVLDLLSIKEEDCTPLDFGDRTDV